jgi:hypothetical protein
MKRFRNERMKWILGLLVLWSCPELMAQSHIASADSVSIFTLMEQV